MEAPITETKAEIKDSTLSWILKRWYIWLGLVLVLGILSAFSWTEVTKSRELTTKLNKVTDEKHELETQLTATRENNIKLQFEATSYKAKYESAVNEKNKWVKKYNDKGVLISDEGSSSSSANSSQSEEYLRTIQTLTDQSKEKDETIQRQASTIQTKDETISLLKESETKKKDFLTLDLGAEWDLGQAKVKGAAGASKTLFSLLGLAFNVRVGVSQ